MNWKTWIPLVLAVVLGLAAALVARESLKRNHVVGPPQPKSVKVVIAKAHVAPGQELTADLLALGPISAETPPPGAYTDIAAVAGRVANTAMFNGQPVMEDLLAPRGAGTGIQALLPRGMRAITVAVDETTGVAGMLLPGSRVDVVSTLNGATKDDTLAATIVQNVLVQAVGQRLTAGGGDKDGQPARTVTLVVSPRDAEAIELATAMGRTRLLLRGSNDSDTADSAGVTFVELRREDKERIKTELVKIDSPVVPPPPASQPVAPKTGPDHNDPFAETTPPRRTVTLIKGGAKTEVTFEVTGKPDTGSAVTKTNNDPLAD